MKQRLVGRLPTHVGAVIITLLGLFVGILLAQLAVRITGLHAGAALLLELVILLGWVAWVWVSLPDRYFTPFKGFYSGEEVEPWVEPKDRDDGRRRPGDDERPDPRDTPAGRSGDPRDDPPHDGG